MTTVKKFTTTIGKTTVDTQGLKDGEYTLFIYADNHCGQYEWFTIRNGKVETTKLSFSLHKKYYTVIKYEINKDGTEFGQQENIKGTLALSHWTELPILGEDWFITQVSKPKRPLLEFHRLSSGFGFQPLIGDFSKEKGPQKMATKPATIPQKPGLRLWCRVDGNFGYSNCYAKIKILAVTATPDKTIPKATEIEQKSTHRIILTFTDASTQNSRRLCKDSICDPLKYPIGEIN